MAGKGPLNYTTRVPVESTAVEVVGMLSRHGASMVGQEFDGHGKPTGVQFIIDTEFGKRQYRLPVNVPGVFAALKRAQAAGQIVGYYVKQDQAERVAWRVIKDWLEAQIAMIEAQVISLEQVMLPYMLIDAHTSVWDKYVQDERALES